MDWPRSNKTEFRICSAVFYQQAYNIDKGYNIKASRGLDYQPGDYVLGCLNVALDPIWNKYEVEEINQYEDCRLWLIKAFKPEESTLQE